MDGSSCQEPGIDLVDEVEVPCRGANGNPIIICDGLFFLFKHLSFLKQPLHIPSTAVNHPQRLVRKGALICSGACLMEKMSPSLTNFPNHSAQSLRAIKNKPYNAIVRSDTDSKTLSVTWPQPDLIELILYSQRVHFFGGESEGLSLALAHVGCSQFYKCASRSADNWSYLACLRHIPLRNRPTQTEYVVQLSRDTDRL